MEKWQVFLLLVGLNLGLVIWFIIEESMSSDVSHYNPNQSYDTTDTYYGHLPYDWDRMSDQEQDKWIDDNDTGVVPMIRQLFK